MFLHGILAVFLMFNNGSIVAQPPPSTDPIVVAASGDVNIDQQTLQATATQIYALIGTIDAAVAAQRASDVFSPAQQLLLQARTVRSLVTNVGTDAKSASLQTDLQGVNTGNDVITAAAATLAYHWQDLQAVATSSQTIKDFLGITAGDFNNALNKAGVAAPTTPTSQN